MCRKSDGISCRPPRFLLHGSIVGGLIAVAFPLASVLVQRTVWGRRDHPLSVPE